jgi:hypothetical protein
MSPTDCLIKPIICDVSTAAVQDDFITRFSCFFS